MKIHLDTDLGGDIDDLCALALLLRWPGVEVTRVPLKIELRDGLLRQTTDADGTPTRVVTEIDGDAFSDFWLDTVASRNG